MTLANFRSRAASIGCLLFLLMLVACSSPPQTDQASSTADPATMPPAGVPPPPIVPAPVPPAPGAAPPPAINWSMWDRRWDPNEIVPCPKTGKPETRAVCAAAAYLEDAAAAFNAPERMERGQTVRIRLAIDRVNDESAAKAAVDKLEGDTVAFPTRAGRYMRATLSGKDFAVKPLGEERKDLFASPLASWEWDVTATGGGHQLLTLRTFVEVPAEDGKLKPAWERIEDREIEVTVTTGQQIAEMADESEAWLKRGENWVLALGAFIAALGGLWFTIRTFGKKAE